VSDPFDVKPFLRTQFESPVQPRVTKRLRTLPTTLPTTLPDGSPSPRGLIWPPPVQPQVTTTLPTTLPDGSPSPAGLIWPPPAGLIPPRDDNEKRQIELGDAFDKLDPEVQQRVRNAIAWR